MNKKASVFREKSAGNKKSTAIPEEWKGYINNPSDFQFEVIDQKLLAIPLIYKEEMSCLDKNLNCLQKGIEIGSIKGKDLIPSAFLALNTGLNKQAFNQVDVTHEEAIRFLKKENYHPVIPLNKGHALVTYQGHPLGFIKYLGSRSNNLYPSEWRIRSGYLPVTLQTLSFK